MNFMSTNVPHLQANHHESKEESINQQSVNASHLKESSDSLRVSDRAEEHVSASAPATNECSRLKHALDSAKHPLGIETQVSYKKLQLVLGNQEEEYLQLFCNYLSGELLKCEFDHFIGYLLPREKGKLKVDCFF